MGAQASCLLFTGILPGLVIRSELASRDAREPPTEMSALHL
jgi:hypothetical protein